MTVTKRVIYRTDTEFDLTFEPVEDSLRATETGTGFTIRYLTYDPDPMPPDNWMDDELFLVHYHRSFHVTHDTLITEQDVRDWYRNQPIPHEKTHWIFAVAAYIHSGVVLQLGHGRFPMDGQEWDTSHVGAVLASKTSYSDKERARAVARCLITEWNSYLCGDVYGIVEERFDAQKRSLDHEGRWGFVGLKHAEEALGQTTVL